MDTRKVLNSYFIICLIIGHCYAMSRKQLKNSGKFMKKNCMPKNGVTEEQVGRIEDGEFLETREVMCYVACIYNMSQVMRNNRIRYELVLRQVELTFPEAIKPDVRLAVTHCKDVPNQHEDVCEGSYRTAKCLYDYDGPNFVFP